MISLTDPIQYARELLAFFDGDKERAGKAFVITANAQCMNQSFIIAVQRELLNA